MNSLNILGISLGYFMNSLNILGILMKFLVWRARLEI